MYVMSMRDDIDRSAEDLLTDRFGDLALHMLDQSRLQHAWRFNFVANFFTGPAYREFERRLDLNRPQFVILYCLSERPGLAAKDVCLVTGLPKNSISRAVSELLGRGLVTRETSNRDRRRKTLILTKDGAALLKDAVDYFDVRQNAMRAALSEEELAVFDQMLRKIIDDMPRWVGEDD